MALGYQERGWYPKAMLIVTHTLCLILGDMTQQEHFYLMMVCIHLLYTVFKC